MTETPREVAVGPARDLLPPGTRSMMLIEPVCVTHDGFLIEVATHKPNPALKRELDHFLHALIASDDSPVKSSSDVLVITTCQESKAELLQWDDEAAREKDRLLNTFARFASDLAAKLKALGYWADYADPASGLLANSPGQVIWPEVQAMERLRGFQKTKAGPCHIILHPKWGSRVYPATMFTNAPDEVVRRVLQL